MKQPNRERKNPIQFKITLTDEQKDAKEGVYEKDVSFFLGNYGSGKTQCAALIALDLLFKGHIDNIIISRPLDFNATGFLTGSASEKMMYHLQPLKQSFYNAYSKEKIDKLFADGIIQLVPIDYMKGYTFTNSCCIIDEFEDINYDEFKLILSRLGKDSKLIFTGSEEQIGIKNSCIPKILKLKDSDIVNFKILKSQHRNGIIQDILNFLENAS